ncbi:MAG: hypothetical protein ACI9IT_002359 [Glaciecola sp.]|jgi:hypothetical protein
MGPFVYIQTLIYRIIIVIGFWILDFLSFKLYEILKKSSYDNSGLQNVSVLLINTFAHFMLQLFYHCGGHTRNNGIRSN